jgi:hypothetical protein
VLAPGTGARAAATLTRDADPDLGHDLQAERLLGRTGILAAKVRLATSRTTGAGNAELSGTGRSWEAIASMPDAARRRHCIIT